MGVWTRAADHAPAASVRLAAQEWDRLGYGCVWIPEARGKEAMAHAAVLLAAAPGIAVGTGIANAWARDPLAMEGGGRTLLDAFPGRFVLGVGVSFPALVEQTRGHRYAHDPVTFMRRYLEAMREAPYEGPQVGRVPRLLAALGPRMLRLAGDGFEGAHTYFVPPAHTREARDLVGPSSALVVQQAAVVAAARSGTRDVARAHARTFLGLPHHRRNLQRLGWSEEELDHGGSDALIDAVVAHGTAEEVVGRVEEHLEAGATHVCVQVIDPRDPLGVGGYKDLAAELSRRGLL